MEANEVLAVLDEAVEVVAAALRTIDDWRPGGERPGQYALDLIADGPCCDVLVAAGFGVLSEESGLHHPDRPITVVVDPVDGSTNASRRIPYYATSLCAVDGDGPWVALVVNQATGERFEAIRGGGARRDGEPIAPSASTTIERSIVGLCGMPAQYWGWAQARVLGAAALDLCAVACGRLDAYVDHTGTLAPWDYLGGMLVCQEAGAVVAEGRGRELVVLQPDHRGGPVAAATPELLSSLLERRHLG